MKTYNTVLSVLLVYFFGVDSQNIGGQVQYERQGGLLSGFGSLGGALGVSSISSGLETIAGGVRNILSTTRDTVEKLTQPISTDFNAQIGLSTGNTNTGPEYGPGNPNNAPIGQSDEYEDNGPEYNPGNLNNQQIASGNRQEYNYANSNQNKGNSRGTADSYPNYETANQNNGDRFNGVQTNIDNFQHNKQHNQENNDGVITYIDNNFPVILLKENEIRR